MGSSNSTLIDKQIKYLNREYIEDYFVYLYNDNNIIFDETDLIEIVLNDKEMFTTILEDNKGINNLNIFLDIIIDTINIELLKLLCKKYIKYIDLHCIERNLNHLVLNTKYDDDKEIFDLMFKIIFQNTHEILFFRQLHEIVDNIINTWNENLIKFLLNYKYCEEFIKNNLLFSFEYQDPVTLYKLILHTNSLRMILHIYVNNYEMIERNINIKRKIIQKTLYSLKFRIILEVFKKNIIYDIAPLIMENLLLLMLQEENDLKDIIFIIFFGYNKTCY